MASKETEELAKPLPSDGGLQEIFFLSSLKASVRDVAQQFATMESELFGKLETREMLFNSWQDPVKAPNFAAVTEQSNGVCLKYRHSLTF